MKKENKIFRLLLSSSPRKNQTEKKFKKIWQFLNRFHPLLFTSKAVPYALVCLVLCVAIWGQNTVDVCFIWISAGSWCKMLERIVHAMTSVRYWRRTASYLCQTIHRQQVDCQIAILQWFVTRLNQLNSSTHGKYKMLLNVSETSSRLNVKYSCGSIEL